MKCNWLPKKTSQHKKCPKCRGTGKIEYWGWQGATLGECNRCGGKGFFN